jgi:hypothetical protein
MTYTTNPSNNNNNNNKNYKNHDNEEDDFLDDDDDDDDNTNGITQTDIGSCVSGIINERIVKGGVGAAPSILSSDLDTTTFFDTENDDQDDDDDDDDNEDDDDGQFSSITGETTNTTASSRRYGQNRNRKRLRHKMQHHQYNQYHTNLMKGGVGHLRGNGRNSLHSSMSSLADSTMSLNIITVTLNMDSVNFLGISIVGQSNKGGEGGIYVGSIMSGYVSIICRFLR